jgi:hypothetical protein
MNVPIDGAQRPTSGNDVDIRGVVRHDRDGGASRHSGRVVVRLDSAEDVDACNGLSNAGTTVGVQRWLGILALHGSGAAGSDAGSRVRR